MALLEISSFDRLARYTSDREDEAATDNAGNRRELEQLNMSVSMAVERYLSREMHIESRTEYFRVRAGQVTFYTDAWPVTTITTVKEDFTGEFDGSESTLSDSYIGPREDSVVLQRSLGYRATRGLQIIYVGGLAYHGTRSEYTVTDATAFTVDNFVSGDDSGAMGIVKVAAGTTLTVENIRGVFTTEGITEYGNEALSGAATATDTISAVAKSSLAVAYPDLARAAEMQMMYEYENKTKWWLAGTDKDSVTMRVGNSPITRQQTWQLQPAVATALNPYRRATIGGM